MSKYSKYDYEDKSSVKSSSSGIGFCGLLTIVFIVLKLCNVIDWNWFWVLSPLVFGFGLGLLIIGIMLLVFWIQDKKEDN